jgi:hypothetical protein
MYLLHLIEAASMLVLSNVEELPIGRAREFDRLENHSG